MIFLNFQRQRQPPNYLLEVSDACHRGIGVLLWRFKDSPSTRLVYSDVDIYQAHVKKHATSHHNKHR